MAFETQPLVGKPAGGESVEAWARLGRYRALAAMARAAGVGLVLLAHHRRDQAETFLLQALRGAGPAGLAAMPSQVERDGIVWARPWLNQRPGSHHCLCPPASTALRRRPEQRRPTLRAQLPAGRK